MLLSMCYSCGKEFTPKNKGKRGFTRYCSRGCANESQRTSPVLDLICARCGSPFSAKQDHGKWPKYCSRACFESQASHAYCAVCGTIFCKKRPSSIHCSKACRAVGNRKKLSRSCAHCGSTFHVHSEKRKQACCSPRCQHAYFSKEKKTGWKGGEYVQKCSGHVRVLVGKNRYIGKHRIIAASILGYALTDERIIFLDGNKTNCQPSNLYLFASNSELATAKQKGMRPKVSNLDPFTYRKPSTRGSTVEVQCMNPLNFQMMLPMPPVGNWSNERIVWKRRDTTLVKTKGTPHPENISLELRKLVF